LLVLGAALAGGLAVKMTQPPPIPAASAPPVSQPVVVPPAPAIAQPVLQPKSIQPKLVTQKKPSPLAPPAASSPAPPAVYTASARRPEAARPAILRPPVERPAVVTPRRREEIAQAKPLDVPPLPADKPGVPSAPPAPVAVKVVVPPPAPAPAAAPTPALHKVTLRPGMTILVRIEQALSTERTVAGNAFTASLVEPIVADGLVIAERGARVTGRVLDAQNGRIGGVPALQLALSSVTTADGQHVSIATDPWTRRGQAVELPGETVVGFRVSSAVTITERRI
jgi:hypothetical protein